MSALPLVLVHGFMGGSAQWDLQIKDLDKDYALITVDLPGFGKNNHLQAPDTIAGFATFVLDALSEMEVERFNLLGHSMGGMIVQEMIALAPTRINKLILYGTASTGNLPGRFETFDKSRERVMEDGVKSTARRISATWFRDFEEAHEYENCAKLAECSTEQALLAGLTAMQNWSRTDTLKTISCPVQILWGEFDRTYRWPQIENLWTSINKASLAVIPNCSHAAHMEQPAIFNLIVGDFLNT